MKHQKKSGSSKKRKHPNPMVRQYRAQVDQLREKVAFLEMSVGALVAKTDDGKVALSKSDYDLMRHAELKMERGPGGKVIWSVDVPEDDEDDEAAA